MKLNPTILRAVAKLEAEACRFELLARESALKAVENTGNDKYGVHHKLTLNHRLRAESFITAASIISR